MQQINAIGWVVYRVDNDGSVLFLGILPTQNQAEREAAVLAATMAKEYFVTGLPLLEWEASHQETTMPAHPPPTWLM